jgi:hypothetical protein
MTHFVELTAISSDLAPPADQLWLAVAGYLARLFSRSPSSVLAKMANSA